MDEALDQTWTRKGRIHQEPKSMCGILCTDFQVCSLTQKIIIPEVTNC